MTPVARPIDSDVQNGDSKLFKRVKAANETCGSGSKTLQRMVTDHISKLTIDRQKTAMTPHRSTVAQ